MKCTLPIFLRCVCMFSAPHVVVAGVVRISGEWSACRRGLIKTKWDQYSVNCPDIGYVVINSMWTVNVLRPGQNGRHFASSWQKSSVFWLKFFFQSFSDNTPALVHVMVWCRTDTGYIPRFVLPDTPSSPIFYDAEWHWIRSCFELRLPLCSSLSFETPLHQRI